MPNVVVDLRPELALPFAGVPLNPDVKLRCARQLQRASSLFTDVAGAY
jgi:hypothetical protein